MPSTLRLISFGMWFLGGFLMVASLRDGWKTEEGMSVPLSEIWLTGAGPVMFAVGVGMVLLATLLCHRWQWARITLMLSFVALFGLQFDPRDSRANLGLLLAAALTIAIAWYYLYLRRDVVAFFRRGPCQEKQPDA